MVNIIRSIPIPQWLIWIITRIQSIYSSGNRRTSNQFNDERTSSAIAQGDTIAFENFHQVTHKHIYRHVLNSTGSAEIAKEIVQEVYADLWFYRGNLQGVQNPRSYLLASAANRIVQYRKKRLRNQQTVSIDDLSDDFYSPISSHSPVEYKESFTILEKALKTLSKIEADTYRLAKIDELSYKEIAKELNISVTHVGYTLSTARKKVESQVGPHLKNC